MKQAQSRSTNQVSELQALAEKHFNRANGLEAELSRVKKDAVLTKKQVSSCAFYSVIDLYHLFQIIFLFLENNPDLLTYWGYYLYSLEFLSCL